MGSTFNRAGEPLIPPIALPFFERGQNTLGWWRFFEKLGKGQKALEIIDTLTSYPSGLTITGLASSGVASISAYTRQYASGAVVQPSGTILGLQYGQSYWIYYDGGYVATQAYLNAFASAANPARQFVGRLTMPVNAGASNTTGTPARPPGYV